MSVIEYNVTLTIGHQAYTVQKNPANRQENGVSAVNKDGVEVCSQIQSTICHISSHNFTRHFKSCSAYFPSQSAVSVRDSNPHRLQRQTDNGSHISFCSLLSPRLTDCDLDLALGPLGKDSDRQATRHHGCISLYYPGKVTMHPSPQPKGLFK